MKINVDIEGRLVAVLCRRSYVRTKFLGYMVVSGIDHPFNDSAVFHRRVRSRGNPSYRLIYMTLPPIKAIRWAVRYTQ